MKRLAILLCISLGLLLVAVGVGGQEVSEEGVKAVSFVEGGRYGSARTSQVTLGDLDGDGDLDAAFANVPGRSEIWMNNGAGHFTNAYQNIDSESRGIGFGDLDGDGDLDLLTAPVSNSLPSRVYFNDGSGRFTPAASDLGDTTISANCMSLFDVEGDGDLDAGIYYPLSQRQSRLYLNDGSGLLSPTNLRLPGIATWVDVDGDGDVDAICLQHEQVGSGYKVFVNLGNGEFQEVQYIPAPSGFFAGGTAVGDLDQDGDLDFVAMGSEYGDAPLTVLLNDGSGVFTVSTPSEFECPPGRIALGDFNDDGAIDVYVGCLGQPPMIGLGDGTGGFDHSEAEFGNRVLSGFPAVGDLDGDGDPDIFAPSYGTNGGPNEVWLNAKR